MLLPTLFSGTLFGVAFFWGSQEENHIVWGGSLKKDMPTCSCQLYFQVPFLGLLFLGKPREKPHCLGGVPKEAKEGHAHVLLPTLFSGTLFGVAFFWGSQEENHIVWGGG